MSLKQSPGDFSANSAALSAWVKERSDDFVAVAQKMDADAPTADRALEIVRDFIVERKLVLYGGQAIDFALRLKGSGIYPDYQTPDYDFYSPQSVDDAYDLAERLDAEGFKNVGAIPAIHVQTMRVKTDYIYVADISYAPPAVFAAFPTVTYKGMRCIHPDRQRADMHLAFCFPLNSPPREDIFHRAAKDLARFRLFQEHYPIRARAPPGPSRTVEVEVPLSRLAVHGFAAFGFLRGAFELLAAEAERAGVSAEEARKILEGDPDDVSEVRPGSRDGWGVVRFALPASGGRLRVATPWADEVVEALGGGAEWLAPYMDSRPRAARLPGDPGVEVYSTKNRLLAVAVLAPSEEGPAVTVVSPQYLLLGFLFDAHAGPDRETSLGYYAATLRLLEAGGALISALRDKGGGPGVSGDKFRAFVESSPFGLPVRTLGDSNRNHSYLARLARTARNVRDAPPGVPRGDLPNLAEVPPPYFLEGGKPRPSFDYAASRAFRQDGEAE